MRVLSLISEKTELDQNASGHIDAIDGNIIFDDVTFSYEGAPVLRNISFRAAPGETIAIVGETDSGKSSLTKLVNRIHDVDAGHIRIDGIDLRDWNLDSLRSQISVIEQDVTLFSRSIAENIAFGLGQDADRERIVQAARDAQAHEFIVEMDPWLRYGHRRTWHHALRWSVATTGHCPSLADGAANVDTR